MGRRFSTPTLRLVITCLGLVLPHSLDAQSELTLPHGPALGATLDRFVYEGEGINAVSFRYSELRPRAFGNEIGVSLFPDALDANALLLASDLGPAFNVSGPGVTVLLKGGLSTLLALGGGFDFNPGYHVGSGMIVRAGERVGIRLDLARHVYFNDGGFSEPIWSVGLGVTSLARRTPALP